MAATEAMAAIARVGGGGLLSPARTWLSVLVYCAIVGAVLASRPAFAFDRAGAPLDFGCGPGRSPFSLGVVTSAAALTSGLLVGSAELLAAP